MLTCERHHVGSTGGANGIGIVVCRRPATVRLSWRTGRGRYRTASCDACVGRTLRAVAPRLVLIVPLR